MRRFHQPANMQHIDDEMLVVFLSFGKEKKKERVLVRTKNKRKPQTSETYKPSKAEERTTPCYCFVYTPMVVFSPRQNLQVEEKKAREAKIWP